MSVGYVEFLVEEPSMEEALRLLLPKILKAVPFEVFPFQCKDELLKRLPQRMQGYANRIRGDSWFRDHARVVIIVDRDDEDCAALRGRMDDIARGAGLTVRAPPAGPNWNVVNRLAIEELEAGYFGDWAAVQAAYPKVPPCWSKRRYRRRPGQRRSRRSGGLPRLAGVQAPRSRRLNWPMSRARNSP